MSKLDDHAKKAELTRMLGELQISHGIHRPDTGWSQQGHPGPEDPNSPHKQYDPKGDPVYDDGSGNISPWEDRPVDEMTISGNPFGYSDEYMHRSKALQDIINGRGYDPATVTEAQKQWIKLQRMGDIWKRVDASDLTNTLKDKQNPRTGSLRGMPDKDRKDLLIRGAAAHKA